MQIISNEAIGVDQGELTLFSDYDTDGPMWTEAGEREARQRVSFESSFARMPSVRVWLTMWDVSNTAIARMDVRADDVDESGFSVIFRTWGDTKIARVRVGWQAIGAVHHPDNWDIP